MTVKNKIESESKGFVAQEQLLKPHLSLKRFADDDPTLSRGAKKRVNFDANADIAGNGRSKCHVCHELIQKGSLRLCLQLQCHRGFKNPAYHHFECFFRNPEASKLEKVEEIYGLNALSEEDQGKIRRAFEDMKGFLPPSSKKQKVEDIETPTLEMKTAKEEVNQEILEKTPKVESVDEAQEIRETQPTLGVDKRAEGSEVDRSAHYDSTYESQPAAITITAADKELETEDKGLKAAPGETAHAEEIISPKSFNEAPIPSQVIRQDLNGHDKVNQIEGKEAKTAVDEQTQHEQPAHKSQRNCSAPLENVPVGKVNSSAA